MLDNTRALLIKIPLTFRLPIILGPSYIIIHLPILLNMYLPSDHAHSLGALLYGAINGPWLSISGAIADYLYKAFWPPYTFDTYIYDSLWVSISAVLLVLGSSFVGFFIERFKARKDKVAT